MPIIIAVFATYALSTLLAQYDGPLGILADIRELGLPDCAVCLAVWIAIPISLIMGVNFMEYFAVLGGSIALSRAL